MDLAYLAEFPGTIVKFMTSRVFGFDSALFPIHRGVSSQESCGKSSPFFLFPLLSVDPIVTTCSSDRFHGIFRSDPITSTTKLERPVWNKQWGLSKKKIFLLGLMLAFLAYGAGAATVKYNLFPYPWIKLMIGGGNPLPKALLQGQPLVAALKKGGYTIFFRHARKRNGQPSPLNFNLFDSVALLTKRAPQHPFLENLCLSDQGKAESWVIGMAFKELGIPLGRIYSSPSCRCRETVEIAFGRVDGLEPSLMYSGIQLEDERSEMETKLHTYQKDQRRAPIRCSHPIKQ